MIKNVKVYDKLCNYLYDTKNKSRLVLATLSLAIGLSLTGCGTNKYGELDINKINSETTSVKDRRDYYQTYVEDVKNNMTDAEKEAYYINIDIEYVGKENYLNDDISFLRNDDVVKGDISNSTNHIHLGPGIYRIISSNVNENNGILGEIEILKPGDNVKLVVDYNNKTVTIEETGKTK